EPVSHNSTVTEYVDESYTLGSELSTEVLYTVVAVDSFDVQSLGHTISLPALSVTLDEESDTLSRGVMNKIPFRVDNRGSEEASGLRPHVPRDDSGTDRVHQSGPFSVEPGAVTKVPVIIGGYDGLDGIADLALRIEQIPQTNSKVKLHHSNSLLVRD